MLFNAKKKNQACNEVIQRTTGKR